ncbi:hypothetical protein Plhal304r1_c076g0163061 [Plasmopara halstedii]
MELQVSSDPLRLIHRSPLPEALIDVEFSFVDAYLFVFVIYNTVNKDVISNLLNLNNQVATHQFRYRFSQPIDFSQYEIALGSISIYYSWRAITAQRQNNSFKIIWPTASTTQLRSPMAPIRQATSITTFNIGLSKTISICKQYDRIKLLFHLMC